MDDISKEIRIKILEQAYKHKHGHIASCFSCVEILLAIKEVMKEGDRFILSKGHAILAEKAVFGKEICCYKTGSLGHGLGVACGIALGDPDHNVYVVVGDGELQEGSCYEAINFAIHHKLKNMFIFCDHNNYQASGKIMDILDFHLPVGDTHRFITKVDGHNVDQIASVFLDFIAYKPLIIDCKTKKGAGVSFMEADPVRFHTEIPSEELMQKAMVELNADNQR